MKSLRNVLLLLVAACLGVTACDEFPEEPGTADGRTGVVIEPVAWPAFLRLQETADLQIQVLDDSGRVVVEESLDQGVLSWVNATPTALTLPGNGILARSGTGAGLGWAKVEITVEGEAFRTQTFRDSIPVVLGGVALATPSQDTTVTSIDDEVALIGAGETVNGSAVAGTGLQWRTAFGGVVEFVNGTTTGDQVRVVARAEGEDTVYVSHPTCQGECEQKILVTVAQEAVSVTMSPTRDTLVAEDQLDLAPQALDANDHEITSEAYVWSSSDEAVATVDENGVVTAVGTGSAEITATARSGEAAMTTVEVLSSGVIKLELTDAPADNLESAVLYLGGAYVLDNQATNGRRYILEDDFQVDLLTLSDTVTVVGDRRVPTGTYSNIFLQVDSARLTLLSGLTFQENGLRALTLTPPAGQQDSLVAPVNGTASVVADDTVRVVVDFDVDRSFPMAEAEGGVIRDVAFSPTTRTLKKEDGATVEGTVGSTGGESPAGLTLKAIRTDVAGDTVYARTDDAGSFRFRYLIPGDYTVSMPEVPACYVANPASRNVAVSAGQVLAATDFSIDPATIDSVRVVPVEDTINALGYQAGVVATAYLADVAQPGIAFDWSSMDPAIATVDGDGMVTGHAVGTVGIIVATCGHADTAYVHVRQVPAEVGVGPSHPEVRGGETVQLNAILVDSAGVTIPGASFEWTSGDTEYATVDAAGLVTGVRTGTVAITATHAASGIAGSVDVSVLVATVEMLEVGVGLGCVLSGASEVLCWGQNPNGELGPNTGEWFEPFGVTSIALPAGQTYTDIGVGSRHACALSSTGDIYCWGTGWNGQLGDGFMNSSTSPVLVTRPTGVTFASVAAGSDYTCATTTANTAYCWGYGSEGRLGNGSTSDRSTPTQVFQPSGVDFADLSTGEAHACALTTGGLPYCWGSNDSGQLGNGNQTTSTIPQAAVLPGGVSLEEIDAVEFGACGLTTTGSIYCWGRNTGSRIDVAQGAGVTFNTPQLLPGTGDFVTMGNANTVVCGARSGGEVLCRGGNYYGQFGAGDNLHRDQSATAFHPGASGLLMESLDGAAWDTMCGLTTSGDPYCWGEKFIGRLGTGDAGWILTPEVSVASGATLLERRENRSCAIVSGAMQCWEDLGPLTGYTGASNATVPTTIPLPAGESVVGLALAHPAACVLTADGDVYCIGENYWGQLGDGTFTSSTNAWVLADAPEGVLFTSVTGGEDHFCAMGSDGVPYCWGDGFSGALGNGALEDVGAPTAVLVPNGVAFDSVAAGGSHTCGTTGSGAIYCWGWNGNGQLGDGSTNGSSVPVQVASAETFVQVSAARATTCALTAAGGAYCWGWGAYGQIGHGTSVGTVSTPTPVAGGLTFESIRDGDEEACAIQADGATYCWGKNYEGQFGTGDTGLEFQPAPAMNGLLLSAVAPTVTSTCGIDFSGAIWCVGAHEQGDTGLGVRGYEMVPVRVGGAGTAASARGSFGPRPLATFRTSPTLVGPRSAAVEEEGLVLPSRPR